MKNNGVKILREQKFDDFELINPNGEKQFAGICEKAVTAREIETLDKAGNRVKIWKIYADNICIAKINSNGKIMLTEEYKGKLKEEETRGTEIKGTRWLEAMVPLKDRYSGKDIEDMKERSSRNIERIHMEDRIRGENKKEEEGTIKNNTIKAQIGVENEEQSRKQQYEQQPKAEEVEKNLGLQEGDIESCTIIKDKRFYDNVPEARSVSGLCMLAYSRSKNEYFIVSKDENGGYKQLDTVSSSRSTTQATTEIRQGEINEKEVGNIMDVKGNPNVAYGVRINPGSKEMEVSELRIDRTEDEYNKYIATELVTTTQRPSERDVEAFDTKNNSSISDEKEILKDYEDAGVKVTRVECLTEEGRSANEILTIEEIEGQIKEKPEEVREAIMIEIKGMEAYDLTQEVLNKIVDNKEKDRNLEDDEGRTPWGDAEARNHK